MKKSCLFAVSALLLLLGGCYGDKGNYDYREINEIVIGARGFEGVEYKLRSGIDELKISPYITASQDPGLTGSYEYEWVVVGQVRNPGERTTIARTRDLDYAVNLPSDDYSLLLRITDPATGLMFSRSTTISVSTAYTRGWLVAAEDEEGAAVVDMVSISRDTLLQRDVVRDDTRHRNPCASGATTTSTLRWCTGASTFRPERGVSSTTANLSGRTTIPSCATTSPIRST